MNDLSRDIATIQSIPAVASILDTVCRVTGMGFSAVARVTEDRWVACSVLDHIAFGMRPGDELRVETTLCHEIRQMRGAVVIDHVDEDEIYRHHRTPRLYGFQSYISVPVLLPDGGFFGTLCAIDPKPLRLNTPEITGMFRLFADLIAFHIDAAEKLAQSGAELLAERDAALLRERFIGVLGHDLRTPLGAVLMGAAELRETPLTGEQRLTVDMMERGALRMSGMIDDVTDLTHGRLGGGIPLNDPGETDLEPVLRQVLAEVRAGRPGCLIGEHLELSGPVRCDGGRMAQLFTNLIVNAVVHGRAGTPVRIRAAGGGAGGSFEFRVTNAAEEIASEVLERLFEPFLQGGGGSHRGGLGLGLYIASQIAKSHGGTLTVHSAGGEICFLCTLPQA